MAQYVEDFKDLDVYKRLYALMLEVYKNVIPLLPSEEKYILADQMRRAAQAAPALLAEGFAKRFQPRHWHRYITDAIGESQEMQHHLACAIDLHGRVINVTVCTRLAEEYFIAIKQLYALSSALDYSHTQRHSQNT